MPQLQPFWAAGFSFSRGHFKIRVPYDAYQPMVFQVGSLHSAVPYAILLYPALSEVDSCPVYYSEIDRRGESFTSMTVIGVLPSLHSSPPIFLYASSSSLCFTNSSPYSSPSSHPRERRLMWVSEASPTATTSTPPGTQSCSTNMLPLARGGRRYRCSGEGSVVIRCHAFAVS
jgi:Glycosyltransferase (GlcNAc)